MADENAVWIKGAEVQGVMVQPNLLTPALGSLRYKHDACRKEQIVGRGWGKSPDWEITPDTVQLLLERGSTKRQGRGITLREDAAAEAFLTKYGLTRDGKKKAAD